MTKKMKTTIGVSTLLLTLAIAAVAFAHGHGYGGGGYGMQRGGYGEHMMGYAPHMRGYGDGADVSEETRTQIEATREAFYKETRELRNEIQDARIAMRDEMRKDDPDKGKVADLQKAISNLQAEFDQKSVSHRLEMRKLVPEDLRGRGNGRGFGRGSGGCWR